MVLFDGAKQLALDIPSRDTAFSSEESEDTFPRLEGISAADECHPRVTNQCSISFAYLNCPQKFWRDHLKVSRACCLAEWC